MMILDFDVLAMRTRNERQKILVLEGYIFEFSQNAFTEFSDKKNGILKRVKAAKVPSCVVHKRSIQ